MGGASVEATPRFQTASSTCLPSVMDGSRGSRSTLTGTEPLPPPFCWLRPRWCRPLSTASQLPGGDHGGLSRDVADDLAQNPSSRYRTPEPTVIRLAPVVSKEVVHARGNHDRLRKVADSTGLVLAGGGK